ncbi:hypothetical protein [Methylocapsa acidiphila]|uniref:hypothetical protein n=1 Tax=Methylocapsa acidiphila TaxID=133552 RepID=UPI000428FBC6|nr:hypothetical protein [Methylocapsa acidiphila]
MTFRSACSLIAIAAGSIGLSLAFPGPVSAQTVRQDCSAKYQAAKTAGTLGDQTWQQFYSQCAAEAKGTAAPTTAAPATAPAPAPTPAAPAANPLKPAAPAAAPSTAVFPTAISPTYAKELPGKARQKTCLDQYKANKATNSNGGLKWIQKGGGYYSECNKRLKS